MLTALAPLVILAAPAAKILSDNMVIAAQKFEEFVKNDPQKIEDFFDPLEGRPVIRLVCAAAGADRESCAVC